MGGQASNKFKEPTMTNVTSELSPAHAIEHARAANADQIGHEAFEQTTVVAPETTATGWDSYQVWRRFIKEARERRHQIKS
jgi:hypothetical protein